MTTTRTDWPTPEERLAALHDKLVSAVEDLASSEAWMRMLQVAARFPDYSPSNVLLIAVQRPDATRVAGIRTWNALGRRVLKGEHGIAILAPCVYRPAPGNTADSQTPPPPATESQRLEPSPTGDQESVTRRELRGFKVVHVFDPLSRDCPTRSVVHRIGECALDCLRSTGLAEERDWQAGGFAGSSPAPAFDPVEGQRRCLAVAYVQVQIGVAEFAGTGFRYVPGSTTRPAAPGRLGRAKLGAGEHPTDQFENGALVADDPGRPWTTLDDHTFVPASLIRHTQLCPLPTSTPALPRGPCRWCISCSSALVSTSWPEGLAADRSVNSDRTAHLNQPPRRPARPGGQSARGDQHSAIPRPPGQPNGLRNAVHLMDAAGVRLPVRARAT
ncbi:ArdC family protein [Cellulomonas sp. P24]|uniref:ArdC family protein n=1 Tax=Cellulomonas sp. P24 TaxID=2885206 RepID=UPI00216B43DA|nr:ArdC family protein [Cellulomonas sp. P24]MCR6492097.1 ssDNA-binding domain-containing protein [Cellulomonas sp. P24]